MSVDKQDRDYVCSLDDRSLKVAKEELNEVPADRLGSVAALREWILNQPHITCRTDTGYLLRVLRGAKFSQLKAREMIDGFLTVKTQNPGWFTNIDTRESRCKELISCGYIIPLPDRDDNGAIVVLVKQSANAHLKNLVSNDLVRFWMAIASYVTFNETTQVNGFNFVIDTSNSSLKDSKIWKLEDLKKWYKAWQGTLPGRFKEFHYLYPGPVFETLLTMTKPLMSSKMRSRLFMHSSLETLYKSVPRRVLPVEYLPDDYTGPNVGTLKQLTETFFADFTSDKVQQEILHDTNDKWGVDESKRPKKTESASSFRSINLE